MVPSSIIMAMMLKPTLTKKVHPRLSATKDETAHTTKRVCEWCEMRGILTEAGDP